MVNARFSEKYIHFSLMNTTDHIFLVLLIKHLVNHYGGPNAPRKLANGTKPSISNLHVLFFPCVVLKATAHVDTKSLNMCHHSQNYFRGIFVRIPQHKNGTSATYLVHVKYFLRVTLYLTKHFLVRYHTRQVHIQRHLQRNQWSCTLRTLHHHIIKLSTL